jgi:hypothetical protein
MGQITVLFNKSTFDYHEKILTGNIFLSIELETLIDDIHCECYYLPVSSPCSRSSQQLTQLRS